MPSPETFADGVSTRSPPLASRLDGLRQREADTVEIGGVKVNAI